MDKELVFDEGGINWNWYTKLVLHEDKTVTIVKHWREHKGEEDLGFGAKDAIMHPNYYHEQVWKEQREGRIALSYFVPEIGWATIRNQKYIFGYEV